MQGVRKALANSSFAERSKSIDEARSKDYFSTIIEMDARSFEKYTIDRMAERNIENDYLANIEESGGAYPSTKEMESEGIKAAFDDLFDTIQVKPDGRRGLFQAPPTGAAFDRWFDGSKVVDANGEPLVVYHGTRSNVEAYDQSFAKSATGDFEDSAIGFMFSNNPNAAGVFAVGVNRQGRRGANVMPVYMSLKNPLIVEFDGQKFTDFELFRRFKASLGTTARATTEGAGVQVQNALRDQGYDGVIVRNAKFGTATPAVTRDAGGPVGENDIFIALDPTQIKSATGNNGNYDPNDPPHPIPRPRPGDRQRRLWRRSPDADRGRQESRPSRRDSVAEDRAAQPFAGVRQDR